VRRAPDQLVRLQGRTLAEDDRAAQEVALLDLPLELLFHVLLVHVVEYNDHAATLGLVR
jgi:hypothetical protein